MLARVASESRRERVTRTCTDDNDMKVVGHFDQFPNDVANLIKL